MGYDIPGHTDILPQHRYPRKHIQENLEVALLAHQISTYLPTYATYVLAMWANGRDARTNLVAIPNHTILLEESEGNNQHHHRGDHSTHSRNNALHTIPRPHHQTTEGINDPSAHGDQPPHPGAMEGHQGPVDEGMAPETGINLSNGGTDSLHYW
ncbi:Hypothetical predicted protein [Pelobates cultripes]|uniref:Uncharacterized protein n=1 Tax=Pelobates cultripes TaxID=61616 RepID=A0AAD1RGF7_PELCU|nr:Hypothetical predicted protein [Pelobates cultripes]CAH2252886.1 Hypothetical predicted protein [Pelobates cultripes]